MTTQTKSLLTALEATEKALTREVENMLCEDCQSADKEKGSRFCHWCNSENEESFYQIWGSENPYAYPPN